MSEIDIPPSMKRLGREGIRRAYEKCQDRIEYDPSGALTSARTLLEATCHYALGVTNASVGKADDLPKLFKLTSEALSIDPKSATTQTNKKIAGAIHTLVQAVGELRNQVGDAHAEKVSREGLSAQAKLAVELAMSVTHFLLTSLDTYVAATQRRTADGEAVLKFDKTSVWRLVDHSRNAGTSLPSFGQVEAEPCLWLVGDSGIYLMSNGNPPMLADGRVSSRENAVGQRRFVAYAEGCGLDDELNHWWSIHGLIAEGSDFSLDIPVEYFIRALGTATAQIVIIGSEDGVMILSDGEFAELPNN